MRIFAGLIAAAAICAGAEGNLIPREGWTAWAARPVLTPESKITENGLTLRAHKFADYGKWITVAKPVSGGKAYRFSALYRPSHITSEDVSVVAILSWCKDEDGKVPLQRDYADRTFSPDEWRRLQKTLVAPAGTQSVKIELALRWTEGGSVEWRSPELVETEAPRPRMARIVTTRLAPQSGATVEGNMAMMAKIIDRAAEHRPDMVVLSENYVDRSVRGTLEQLSQTVPGPATQMLANKARQYKTWIVTTLHEIENDLVYNTAVVIDREGRLAGKYRKIHLALEEGERGITPGSDYGIFRTDFGTIGVLTCWDNWFVESARTLRLKGAEMLVLPIAGDGVPGHWDVISRARALDNGVYFVSSNTMSGSSSRIVAPTGKVLAETSDEFGIAYAEIDMDAVERVRYLSVGASYGDPRDLYVKERRPDTYGSMSRDTYGIRVSTNFENGNLESYEVLSDAHVRAKVRAESDQNRRNRQPSWFYFRLDGVSGRDLMVDLTGPGRVQLPAHRRTVGRQNAAVLQL